MHLPITLPTPFRHCLQLQVAAGNYLFGLLAAEHARMRILFNRLFKIAAAGKKMGGAFMQHGEIGRYFIGPFELRSSIIVAPRPGIRSNQESLQGNRERVERNCLLHLIDRLLVTAVRRKKAVGIKQVRIRVARIQPQCGLKLVLRRWPVVVIVRRNHGQNRVGLSHLRIELERTSR